MQRAVISSSRLRMDALSPPPKRVFALAIAIVCLNACQHGSTQLPFRVPPAQHRILAFGDSLAMGVGASDPSRGFMFALFRKVLSRDPGAQITNYAVGGARVEDVLHYELVRAHAENATDIWVCIGGNDVTHTTAAARFASQDTALLRALRRRWPAARIVVFGVPDVSRSALFAGQMRGQLRDLSKADNEAARQAAAGVQASFVDLFALGRHVVADRDFSADNFHPSDAGYDAIEQAAEPIVLRSVFE